MKLSLIKTNNYFGQHHFQFETTDIDSLLIQLNDMVWFKTPKIVAGNNKIDVFCFNNYDKAAIERKFISE